MHVNGFVDWWLEMDSMLAVLESNVGQLEVTFVAKLQVKTIKTGWGKVREEYSSYKTQVRVLAILRCGS